MSSVYVVVEGRGEQAFAQQTLAPHLAQQGVWLQAPLVGKPGHKGGVRRWASVEGDLVHLLRTNKPDRPVYVTTMFDFFRMPMDWPGRREARDKPFEQKASTVEDALAECISAVMGEGFLSDRFLPYIQMHEFESLILASPLALVPEFPDRRTEVEKLAAAVQGLRPEEIDDDPDTAPSARIIERIPEYKGRKGSAAPNVLDQIGIETLRGRCEHFGRWLAKLESLASAAER